MTKMFQFQDTRHTVVEADLIFAARADDHTKRISEHWKVTKVIKRWFKPNIEKGEWVYEEKPIYGLYLKLKGGEGFWLDYGDDVKMRDAELTRIAGLDYR